MLIDIENAMDIQLVIDDSTGEPSHVIYHIIDEGYYDEFNTNSASVKLPLHMADMGDIAYLLGERARIISGHKYRDALNDRLGIKEEPNPNKIDNPYANFLNSTNSD